MLSNIGSKGPASFHANFSNPLPPGEITTSGEFGPWNPDDVAKTVVSGEYLFQQADLGVFRGIAGQLASSGNFSGTLGRMEVQGVTDSPRFTVTSSSHQVQLRTQFHAVVNGENGDTFLQRVVATFWKTTVSSEANVAGVAGQPGKTASVELTAKDVRDEEPDRIGEQPCHDCSPRLREFQQLAPLQMRHFLACLAGCDLVLLNIFKLTSTNLGMRGACNKASASR